MEALNKFRSLSEPEKRLLLKAVFLILLIRFIMVMIPFNIINGFIVNTFKPKKNPYVSNYPLADRIRWAVDAVSNKIPFAKNCLIKSMTIHILLTNYGYESTMHFGVAKDNEHRLKAQAWIESEGKVFSGESELGYYTLLKS